MAISITQDWTFLQPGILICVLSFTGLAQQPRSPQLPAPPPMRCVSAAERSELNAARDPKSRIRTTIDLASIRLTRSEEFTSQKNFDLASEELGGYLGLIDNVRVFVGGMNRDKGSTRDLYRHLEIALRAHIPRLAVMRRSTPAGYAGNLKDAEEYLRDARSEALDSFYGQSVLREAPVEKKPAGPKDPDGVKHP
jgi:hypothetical protein